MITGFGNISNKGSSEKNGIGKTDGMRMTRSDRVDTVSLMFKMGSVFVFF